MDFSLSEEQKILGQEARRFLEKECPTEVVRQIEEGAMGYSPELWRKVAGLGWTAMPFPEKYGGVGSSFLDLVVLIEEMGRACFPSPFIPSVVLSGLTILDIGNEVQKEELLPGIASGDVISTLALLESSDNYEPSSIASQASYDGNGFRLQGTKLFVPDAHCADLLLLVVRIQDLGKNDSAVAFFVINTKSEKINYYPLKTIAGDRLFEVNLDMKVPIGSMLGKIENGKEGLRQTLERGAVAKCAEMVGGAQKVLEMSLNYAKERKQFGHPIGSYQAIQHYCANMAIDVEASRLNTYHAAWLMSEGLPASKQAAVAKAWVSEAYRRVVALGHQIHGAIGFTKEMDLELYIRRAKAAEVAFGDADFHREAIVKELLLHDSMVAREG
jgi:alkylation response protein AidB-like acyl-CoA dehydrogenase